MRSNLLFYLRVKLAESPDHVKVAIKRFKKETATISTLQH
jgi:hypothetical protein